MTEQVMTVDIVKAVLFVVIFLKKNGIDLGIANHWRTKFPRFDLLPVILSTEGTSES